MKNHKKTFWFMTLHIRFNKADGFIKVFDGTSQLLLFGPKKYVIYNKITYLITQESSITYVFSHNNARIKVDSKDCLPLEKTLAIHNAIILIKSVFKKNQNYYYYNIFLETYSYQLLKNNDNK